MVMAFVCLLGLMIGAIPPAMPPSAGDFVEVIREARLLPRERIGPVPPPVVPLLEFRPAQVETSSLEADEAAEGLDADLSLSSWLSPRERWCRRRAATNSVALRDVLTLYADLAVWDEERIEDGLTVVHVSSIWLAQPPAHVAHHTAFVQLLLESLQIRTSDRPPAEKGRRIARLIKPWMTWEQVHALFGESKALLWDYHTWRVTFVAYGVSIDRCGRVVCRDDSDEAKNVRWDWVTEPPEREQTCVFASGFFR
jgi:hypothetical protein